MVIFSMVHAAQVLSSFFISILYSINKFKIRSFINSSLLINIFYYYISNKFDIFCFLYYQQILSIYLKLYTKTHITKVMCAIKSNPIQFQKQRNQIILTEQQPQPQSLLLSFQYLHQFQNERIL